MGDEFSHKQQGCLTGSGGIIWCAVSTNKGTATKSEQCVHF